VLNNSLINFGKPPNHNLYCKTTLVKKPLRYVPDIVTCNAIYVLYYLSNICNNCVIGVSFAQILVQLLVVMIIIAYGSMGQLGIKIIESL
jgi:hypothetical protein